MSNDNAESRELYSEGIYSLAYHQLTVNQKYVVDAAVDVGNTRPQPRFTETELTQLIEDTLRASSIYNCLLRAPEVARALIAAQAVNVREG